MNIHSYETSEELGSAAAERAADVLRERLSTSDTARVMLAAAPSQQHTLEHLVAQRDIDFSRVEFFHMDEYLGLDADAPQAFGNWLRRVAVDKIRSGAFHRIDPSGDPAEEALRYGAVMGTAPFDLVLCGLGVNGHLAFNDPPADLDDPLPARVVALAQTSRQQQLDEGHFARLEDVPTHAITVTIPRLLDAAAIVVSVPGVAKRQAVEDTLTQPISGEHPGTSLRMHPKVDLYLDAGSTPRPEVLSTAAQMAGER